MSWQLRNALTSLIILGASSRSTELTLPPPPDTGVQPSHASSATRLCRYCNGGLGPLTNGVESVQLGVGGGEGSEHLEPVIILLFLLLLHFHTGYHGQQQTVCNQGENGRAFNCYQNKKNFSMPFSLFPPKTEGGDVCVSHAVTGESVARALPSCRLTQITLSCTS